MNIRQLIKDLKDSNLWAECPCGGKFKLKDAVLFDGTKPFPIEALSARTELEDALKERRDDLKKRKKLATEKAEITSKAVNIGGSFEKVLPTLKCFNLALPDCRFLGNPIDMVTFNGLSTNKINTISFIEVKTGGARLKNNQKWIKDAIEDGKVSYKVYR